MREVNFIYNGARTTIQCEESDKFKDVIKGYKNKTGNEIRDVVYIYGGNIISNVELTIGQIESKTDKDQKKLSIQINDINMGNEEINTSKIKSNVVICPVCKEISRMKIGEDYKIKIYGCRNNHETNNIRLMDYFETQYIDEAEIVCKICNINKKSDSYNKLFYRCNTCKKDICVTCRGQHDNNHNIVEYDKRYYYCEDHKEQYNSYCNNCNKNLCILCEEKHNNHNKIYYGNILCKKEEAIKKMKTLRKEINRIQKNIKNYIYKLNKTKEYLDIYYDICNDIINNYSINKRNYEILKNVEEVNKEEKILNEIKNINNNEINKILTIYDKIIYNNEINIIYNKNNEDKIKIFGDDFVKNNKNKCKFIYNNKENKLKK